MTHDRLTTRQALRRFTLGSSPLKRTSDRLQHLARVLLVCLSLLAVAVALAVATAHYTSARAEADAQTAERHRVVAELTEDERTPRDESGNVPATGRATAVWTDSAGIERRGIVPVPEGAKAGSTVSIWIDREGSRTTRPVSDGDVAAESIGYALLTYLGITATAVGAYWLFRRMLDRARARQWAAEWADVEPVWTRTVP